MSEVTLRTTEGVSNADKVSSEALDFMLSYIPTKAAKAAKERKKSPKVHSCATCPLSKVHEAVPVFTKDMLLPFDKIREKSDEKVVVILVSKPYDKDHILSPAARSLVAEWTKSCIKADKIYMFPVIKCPHTREPTKNMVVCCEDILRRELVNADPDIIICLGKGAATPFNLSGKAAEMYNRIYEVQPIREKDPKTKAFTDRETRICKLIVTYDPEKFVEDYKLRSSVEAAFNRANRQISGETINVPDNYYLIESPEEFKHWVDIHLSDSKLRALPHAFDIETNGREIHPKTEFELKHPAKIRCISYAWYPGHAICVPIERDPEHYLPEVKRFMQSSVGFLGHNVMFDYFFLKEVNGIVTKRLIGDTMLMASLITPGKGKYGYGLKPLAAEYTDLGGYETDMKSTEDIIDSEGNIEKTKWEIADMDVMAPYNCADSDATLQLFTKFIQVFKERNMLMAHWIMTNALIPLGEMEHNGFMVDRKWVDESRAKVEAIVKQYEQDLIKLGDGQVHDWNSPSAMGDFMYDVLKYDVPVIEQKFTKNDEEEEEDASRPTGDIALSMINTPFSQTLRKYRKASKLLSTYFNGYLVNTGLDNKLRADFNLVGTVTGRLSSSGDAKHVDWRLLMKIRISKYRELLESHKAS